MSAWEKVPAELTGKVVVLDTRSPLIYIGVLEEAADGFFRLRDVDVHDQADGHSSKELYVLTARKHGVRANRRRAIVRAEEVVSLSLLEDVVEY